jgi:hypothetical protein
MCDHDYDWILNDVAVGNIRAGSDLDHLRQQGISVIICTIPLLPRSIEDYKAHGMSLLHIPIDDSPEVDIGRWFDGSSDFIMSNRLMNRKVLVHCHAGMSRSVSIVCAFLINLFQCDHVRCLYWIREKRPCIAVNPGFLRQLESYGRKFKSS